MARAWSIFLTSVLTAILMGSPVSQAAISSTRKTQLINLEKDQQFLRTVEKSVSASQRDVRDIRIIKVMPTGQDRALMFFAFMASRAGHPLYCLAIGDLKRADEGWYMTGWGGSLRPERPKNPFTLSFRQPKDGRFLLYGVINDRRISHIVAEMNGSPFDLPIFVKDHERFYLGVIQHPGFYIKSVVGFDDLGNIVYRAPVSLPPPRGELWCPLTRGGVSPSGNEMNLIGDSHALKPSLICKSSVEREEVGLRRWGGTSV